MRMRHAGMCILQLVLVSVLVSVVCAAVGSCQRIQDLTPVKVDDHQVCHRSGFPCSTFAECYRGLTCVGDEGNKQCLRCDADLGGSCNSETVCCRGRCTGGRCCKPVAASRSLGDQPSVKLACKGAPGQRGLDPPVSINDAHAAEPVYAPASTANSLLHHVLTPQDWGVFNGRFNASKALRACVAYSPIGVVPTITAMLFDFAYAPWLLRKGLAVRTSEHFISAPWQKIAWDMFAASMITLVPLVGFGIFITADGLWPVVLQHRLEPFQMLWATCLMLLVHDAYYYFLHRALHASRWLYRHVHAHHHDPRVMLEARTGLVISCAESVLGHCIPYAFTLAMNMILFTRVSGGVHYANVLTLVAPIIVSTQLGMIGHSGMRYSSPLVLVALNPLFACMLFTGTAHSPTDHQLHHERGRHNLSLYFRHWDDWMGTHISGKGDTRAGASPFLILYNLAYYWAFTYAIFHAKALTLQMFSRTGLTALCCLALLPVSTTGWSWFRRLPLWDAVRDAYACSAIVTDTVPFDPAQKYVFAYHPHGRLARGLWLMFGLTGRKSPVSHMRISLPVVNSLLSIPGVRHLYGIAGGCKLDKATLVDKLKEKEPTSIAIAPGGLAEARFGRSNKVLLSKRFGFVRLAVETGAQLVPVLGVGEELVGGGYATTLTAALLLPAKRVFVNVVFGKPMKPQPEEDLAAFHARYVAALVELGKQHGVELDVV